MVRRLAGIVLSPRATLAEVVRQPTWIFTWLVILIIWSGVAAGLLFSSVGQQALVDERVRVVEVLGGTIDDAEYQKLQASPPWWVYFTSGGRTLLTPFATIIVAAGVLVIGRLERTRVTIPQALAVVVHASVVLLLGQLLATPLHFVRESLTTPFNLAAVLPLMQEGTWPARFFGTLDVFALWWAGLIAMGLSTLTGRRVGRYLWPILAFYVTFAALVAVIISIVGGA